MSGVVDEKVKEPFQKAMAGQMQRVAGCCFAGGRGQIRGSG